MISEANQKKTEYSFLIINIFLVSTSVISLQIILQRFLSVVLTYHFVFVVVSLALFGLSMGSLLAYTLNRFLDRYDPFTTLVRLTYSYFTVMALSYIVAIYVNHFNLFQSDIVVYSSIFVFPFLVGGMYYGRLFYTFPSLCGQLYGSDLIGAACGCIGIIYLLNVFAISHSVFLITVIPLLISTILLIKQFKKIEKRKDFLSNGLMILVAFSVSITVLNLPEISIGQNPQKEIFDALHTFDGKILESKNSARGRTDLITFEDYPHLMDIYVDGTAGMPMYQFNGDFADPNPAVQNLKNEFPGYFPLYAIDKESKNNALIIGPGGGRDILLAKMAGFQEVTAVELNQEIVRIVKKYSDYNGNIYGSKGLNLNIAEGRSFLKQSDTIYDLIMFSLPVTNTSQGLGSYALTENFLYTKEALSEYLDHLNNDGHIVIVTHNDLELLRLLTTILKVFKENDIPTSDAMQHLYVLGSNDYPVLVIKKQKFQKGESAAILKGALAQDWIIPGSSFFPQVKMPYLNNMLLEMENSNKAVYDLVDAVSERGYDIRPVTDRSPFFYKLNKNLPDSLINVLYFSLAAIGLFLFLPLSQIIYARNNRKSRKGSENHDVKTAFVFSTYFLMIGIGFMILEITMIQRFMLVFGSPIFSMATVIFTILVGAGLGSLTSSRLKPATMHKNLITCCIFIISLSLFYVFSLTSIFSLIDFTSIFLRILITFFLLFPLGFAMGFPLPVAIRFIKLLNKDIIIPWMLAINGASSVFGSAITIILAITYGYNSALLAAAFCYLVVLISSYPISAQARSGS